jgi:signal transduction histidine kinase
MLNYNLKGFVMIHSVKLKLKYKMTFLLLFLITASIFLSWIFNKNFLKDYYIYSEKKILEDNYYKLQNQIVNSADGTCDILYLLSADRQASTFIADIARINGRYFITDYYSFINPQSLEFDSFKELALKSISNVNVNTMGYKIFVSYDEVLSTEFLLLQGMIDSDTVIVMRLPMENIEKSINISNRFFLYSGLIIIVAGTIIIYIISRRITKPINEMALVAEDLITQKFDKQVNTITNDELGDLGKCINLLSSKLKETLSELKNANSKLQNDIKYKTEIENIRREFLTEVSHELKTPISLIQGYSEGLYDNLFSDEENMKYYAGVIIDEANKMNALVSKLIVLNQIEFGSKEINITYFDIIESISNCIKSFHSAMEEKKLEIKFDSDNSIFAWADELMMEEVINNYLSNAICHAVDESVIYIYYRCTANNIRIFIRNMGEQIPLEDMDKIWNKLYKVDKSRSREQGGAGLGLALVGAIMNAHGKEYGFNNVEDGVEFYFDLNIN